MAVSIFADKLVMPNDGMVAAALADAYALWDTLQTHIRDTYPNVTGAWKHYGKAAGWSYQLISQKKSKKQTVIYCIPNDRYCRVRIVLGEKAAARAEDAALPDDIKAAIRDATPYVEGRSIDMDISRPEQLETVKELLRIKFDG